jgi:hypothetical protein
MQNFYAINALERVVVSEPLILQNKKVHYDVHCSLLLGPVVR